MLLTAVDGLRPALGWRSGLEAAGGPARGPLRRDLRASRIRVSASRRRHAGRPGRDAGAWSTSSREHEDRRRTYGPAPGRARPARRRDWSRSRRPATTRSLGARPAARGGARRSGCARTPKNPVPTGTSASDGFAWHEWALGIADAEADDLRPGADSRTRRAGWTRRRPRARRDSPSTQGVAAGRASPAGLVGGR